MESLADVVRCIPTGRSRCAGAAASSLWVRPLHSILATFGPETEEPDVVKFSVDGISASDQTRGHRFMAPGAIKVRRFDDYAAKLLAAKVMLDPALRTETILADAKNSAFAQGYELVEDAGLLAEVAGLVEWPVTLMGSFDQAFLAIPGEVIRATIRTNQKCFVLRDPQTAKLANKFILVANEEAADGGKAITAGNERVIRARLSDAKFFYDTDLKTRLEDRLPKFEQIVFHEKLGTQAERIKRIEALAGEMAEILSKPPRFLPRQKIEQGGIRAGAGLLHQEGPPRRAIVQSRLAHGSGRRIPRAARLDGEVLRRSARRGRSRRPRLRGPLQAERAGRSGAGRSGFHCRRACRQDRHAYWILGNL